jgi:hypothetical protein
VRGRIEILNRAQLETNACECYFRLKQHGASAASLAARLIPPARQQDEAARASAPPRPATA